MTATAPARGTADLRALARGGVLNIVAAGFGALAQFAIVVVLTRGFSKHSAGVFFAATTVFLVGAALARLGTDVGLVYFIARSRALGRAGRAAAYVRVAVPAVLGAAVAAGAGIYAAAPWLADVALDGAGGEGVRYLRALAVFLPAAVLSDTALAATRGFRAMRPTALTESIGRQAVQLAALAAAAVAGATWSLGLGWAGPYLLSAVVAVLWLRSLMRGTGDGAAEPGTAREFWRYTAPRAVASLAQIVLQRFDIVLVASLLGPVQAAVYTAATRFVVVGQIGNQALGQAVQPQLSEVLSRGDLRGARELYQTATSWLVLLTWPVYLLFAAFAPHALRLFGPGYQDGATVVVVLSLTMLFATICGQVDTVLIMAGKTSWNLANIVLAMSVNIAADAVLIPRMGITGAAVGWSIGLVVKNAVPLVQIAVALRLHPFGRGTLTAAALAALCLGVPPLVPRLLGGGLVPLAAAGALGAAGYAAACLRARDLLKLDRLRRVRRGTAAP
ncbi:Polysaccharide biosynthesis protein [Actinomadura rubteroloni]|uniref:Polysaccharide biosynthesis protein n=1 Tax=Actinomadura rubteroloni TaxID=1926885 RepID=A0A2P4UPZ9_9ACTN|nr:polysaccharide biosynthesis C-terminal domain-containing protein [Actinomadura rubteroloni]POM27126.1 Polysaccharide biosynthesis protein [Actinomadura rubteroloni]